MVAAVKSFIERYPRLVWFGLGLLVAVIVSGSTAKWADRTIEEYKQLNALVIEEYKVKEIEQRSTIDTLRQENSKLKQRVTTYKLVKPDGTIEERTDSEVESERQLSESIKEEYYKKLHEATDTLHREYSSKIQRIVSERKRLMLTGGLVYPGGWLLQGSYQVLPPMSATVGVIVPRDWDLRDTCFILGLGVSL